MFDDNLSSDVLSRIDVQSCSCIMSSETLSRVPISLCSCVVIVGEQKRLSLLLVCYRTITEQQRSSSYLRGSPCSCPQMRVIRENCYLNDASSACDENPLPHKKSEGTKKVAFYDHC